MFNLIVKYTGSCYPLSLLDVPTLCVSSLVIEPNKTFILKWGTKWQIHFGKVFYPCWPSRLSWPWWWLPQDTAHDLHLLSHPFNKTLEAFHPKALFNLFKTNFQLSFIAFISSVSIISKLFTGFEQQTKSAQFKDTSVRVVWWFMGILSLKFVCTISLVS